MKQNHQHLQQPERDHAKTVGYYETITMIPDHLAFQRCKKQMNRTVVVIMHDKADRELLRKIP